MTIRVGILACAFACLATRVQAQPPSATEPTPAWADGSPWATGISAAEQDAALELYKQGNAEFKESRFTEALAKYKEAIKHWDHPAIRFNMAVCLVNLDQPLDAIDNLERGLQYGDAALGPDVYAQGLTYRKLLDGQLTHVKVSCKEPGAQVMLDGKHLFTGPGEVEERVLPGGHQVVATKQGFETATETLSLVPGKLVTYDVRLVAFKATAKLVRRWRPWKPWAVIGGGVAVFALGAAPYLLARQDLGDFDRGISTRCPSGCNAAMEPELAGLRHARDRAATEQTLAFGLFSAGGAIVVAGVAGLVLNQPRTMLEGRLPVVAPTAGGATVRMGWRF